MFLKVGEAAKIMQVSPDRVESCILSGEIRNVNSRSPKEDWRIHQEEVDEYMERDEHTMFSFVDWIGDTGSKLRNYFLKHFAFDLFRGTERLLVGHREKEDALRFASHLDIEKKRYLYFIRCEHAIKVGVAANPRTRASTLQTGCPFPHESIWFCDGGGFLESCIHIMFDCERVRPKSEWFHERGVVKEYIDLMPWFVYGTVPCSG